MAKSRRHEIGVGLLLIAAVALLAWMSLKVGGVQNLGDSIVVQAELEDAAGLSEGAEVKVAGVPVGLVESLVVEHDKAILSMRIQTAAQLREDAILQVRARSLLGEKYVEIRPQGQETPLLENGDTLNNVEGQTEIDQLVNQLGPLVETLNPSALGDSITVLQSALESDPDRLKRILEDGETILSNTAEASEHLPTIAEESERLIQDLRELTDEADQTLADVRRVTETVDPVADEATAVMERTDQLVGRIDQLVVEVDQFVGQLGQTIEPVPNTLSNVDLLVEDLRGAVSEGRTVIGKLDESTNELSLVLQNMSEIDKVELRRLLREEGILVRIRESEVKDK